MNSTLDSYFQALERIKSGTTHRIHKGARITNDAVALEAGKSKGSIKKSRPGFSDLLAAIQIAKHEQLRTRPTSDDALKKAKRSAAECREALDRALAREVSLLQELYSTRQRLAKLTGENILPIRGGSAKVGSE